MASTSAELLFYRERAAKLISAAISRPSMYPDSLTGLIHMMGGHAMAFGELYDLANGESFKMRFSIWLWEARSISGCSGWAKGISAFAKQKKLDEMKVFHSFVAEFLSTWIA